MIEWVRGLNPPMSPEERARRFRRVNNVEWDEDREALPADSERQRWLTFLEQGITRAVVL